MESAVTASILVLEENGNPVPGVTVQLIDAAGSLLANLTSDGFGRVPTQVLVSHLWRRQNNGGGILTWRKEDTPPAGITASVFSPFLLLVTADGFGASLSIHYVDAFEPKDQISERVILRPPTAEEAEGQ
jgi:hypothetical protein